MRQEWTCVCLCGGGGGGGRQKKVRQIFSVCVFNCFRWGYCLSLFVRFAKNLLLNLFVSNQGTIEFWMTSLGHAIHSCGPFCATLRTSNKSLRTNSLKQNGELRRPEDVWSGGISKSACKDFGISMRQGNATCRHIGTPWHIWCKNDSPCVYQFSVWMLLILGWDKHFMHDIAYKLWQRDKALLFLKRSDFSLSSFLCLLLLMSIFLWKIYRRDVKIRDVNCLVLPNKRLAISTYSPHRSATLMRVVLPHQMWECQESSIRDGKYWAILRRKNSNFHHFKSL